MIQDPEAWEAWETEYKKSTVVDFERNKIIYEALYAEAVRLGALPPKDLMENLSFKIRLAEALNVRRAE